MKDYIFNCCKAICHIPKTLFPSGSLFIAYADGGNHFLDYGIQEGTVLFFDSEVPFKNEEISCFVNRKTGDFRVLRKPIPGYEHAGKLVATLNYIGDYHGATEI